MYLKENEHGQLYIDFELLKQELPVVVVEKIEEILNYQDLESVKIVIEKNKNFTTLVYIHTNINLFVIGHDSEDEFLNVWKMPKHFIAKFNEMGCF